MEITLSFSISALTDLLFLLSYILSYYCAVFKRHGAVLGYDRLVHSWVTGGGYQLLGGIVSDPP